MRRSRLALASVLLLASPVLVGCGVAENIVGGVVGQAQDTVNDAIGDALGGAGITSNGELPSGFPSDAVPITGTVQGGGAGPDSSGWVLQTTLTSAGDFTVAQTALEGAGYMSAAVDSDADSGFGTFTSDTYSVIVTVTTADDGVVTATYVVTPV